MDIIGLDFYVFLLLKICDTNLKKLFLYLFLNKMKGGENTNYISQVIVLKFKKRHFFWCFKIKLLCLRSSNERTMKTNFKTISAD